VSVKRGLSSVQRTLRACRDQGRFVEKVEQWVSYGPAKPGMPSGTRRDAFGFIDILAIDSAAIVAIQACTQSGAEHLRKIQDNEYALAWLHAGGIIELWIWRKVKEKRGGKRERWQPRIENITTKHFETQQAKGNDYGKDERQNEGAAVTTAGSNLFE